MKMNDYQRYAERTAPKAELLNAAMGLCGESGELMDHLKKVTFQGHGLDNQKLIEELGDVLWYVAHAATAMGVTLEYVASTNVAKLQRRYPSGFSVDRSVNRDER